MMLIGFIHHQPFSTYSLSSRSLFYPFVPAPRQYSYDIYGFPSSFLLSSSQELLQIEKFYSKYLFF